MLNTYPLSTHPLNSGFFVPEEPEEPTPPGECCVDPADVQALQQAVISLQQQIDQLTQALTGKKASDLDLVESLTGAERLVVAQNNVSRGATLDQLKAWVET